MYGGRGGWAAPALVSGPDLFAGVIDESDRIYRAGACREKEALVFSPLRVHHDADLLVVEFKHLGSQGDALCVAGAQVTIDRYQVRHCRNG